MSKRFGFTLAEGATHVANSAYDFKKGFTLAEVLITLGIIGVVAAMTIPTLIANTNSSKFASQFKKSLSTLNQAALMAKAQWDTDYGTLDNKNASGTAYTAKCDNEHSMTKGASTICGLFNSTLSGATYVADVTTLKANNKGYKIPINGALNSMSTKLTSTNTVGYQMADGSLVVVPMALAGCTKATDVPIDDYLNATKNTNRDNCIGYIDVNGATLPNKEVSCGEGGTVTAAEFKPSTICTVAKDTAHMTDIYPIVFHDGTVEPATNAAKAVLTGATKSSSPS